MAYPNYQNYYQQPYSQYYQQPYFQQPVQPQQPVQQPAPQPMQQQTVQQTQPQQIQDGGIMLVKTPEEAYNWPIAPGIGMLFKVENQPLIISKARSFSPLEQPIVKDYDMIERVHQQTEPVQPQEAPVAPAVEYAERSDVEALRRDVETFMGEMRADLQAIKDQPIVAEIKRTSSKAKKEVEE